MNLTLALAAAVVLLRVVSAVPRTERRGAVAVCTTLAWLLLVGAAVLLAVDALVLYVEFNPPELNPFNCGN